MKKTDQTEKKKSIQFVSGEQRAYMTFLFGLICAYILPFSLRLIIAGIDDLLYLPVRMIGYYSDRLRYPELVLFGLLIWCLYSLKKDIRLSVAAVCGIGTAAFLFMSLTLMHRVPDAESVIMSLVFSAALIMISFPVHKADEKVRSISGKDTGRIIRLIFWCALTAYILPFVMDYVATSLGDNPYTFYDLSTVYIGRYLLEEFFYVLLLALLLVMTGSPVISFVIMIIPYCIITTASAIKFSARADYLHASDLFLLEAYGPAFRAAGTCFSFTEIMAVLVFVAVYILFTILLFRKTGKYIFKLPFKKIAIPALTVLFILMSSGIFFLSSYVEFKSLFSSEYDSLTSNRFILSKFFGKAGNTTILPGPDQALAYFDQKSGSSEHGYDAGETAPDIIVIMNESWWNTDNILWDESNISVTADPMEPVKKLQGDNCSLGYVNVNSFGGGTLHSEIEFLTGMNSKYIGMGDSLYEKLGRSYYPSIVGYFNALGYSSVAMHPGGRGFYGRETAYEQMDFDRILFEPEFTEREKYFSFISDKSVMKEVLNEYENIRQDSGSPAFIWAVTIANHSHILVPVNDEDKTIDFPIKVEFKNDELNPQEKEMVNDYINGIYLSNEAFAFLTDEFRDADRPVIILMYGDHCPQFDRNILKQMGIGSGNDLDTKERLYTTPAIIWSNIDGFAYSPEGENVSLMMAEVLKEAGLPDCDMLRVIRSAGTEFRADTKYVILDNAGKEIERFDEKQYDTILNLHSIQYAFVKSDPKVRDLWTPETR